MVWSEDIDNKAISFAYVAIIVFSDIGRFEV